jgi:hypothetical protein
MNPTMCIASKELMDIDNALPFIAGLVLQSKIVTETFFANHIKPE